jgi:hypothetical protein
VVDPEKLRDKLGKLSWVLLAALSVRKGVWILTRISQPKYQHLYWKELNNWLIKNFGLPADPKRKNSKDLRVYSPDADVIFNPNAIILRPPEPLKPPSHQTPITNLRRTSYGLQLSPIDDFNERGDVIAMLIAEGWNIYHHHNNNIRLTRPGKSGGTSADWSPEHGKLYVFTDNSVLQQTDERYPLSPTDVFMQLNGITDLSIAIKQLREMGYGA